MRPCLVVMLLLLAACNRTVADGAADGAAVYAEACARCHGADGRPPPALAAQLGVRDLTDPELQARMSVEDVRDAVAKGSLAKGMPAFAGALTEAQIAAVAEMVKTLGRPPSRAPPPASTPAGKSPAH